MRRPVLIWTLTGVTAVALMVTGLSAWALTSDPGAPQKQAKADSAPLADGIVLDKTGVPALYTGDELEWLLLSKKEFSDALHAEGAGEISAAYGSVGESDGRRADPEECIGIELEDFTGIVGYRQRGSGPDAGPAAWMGVGQFATSKVATTWAEKAIALYDECHDYQAGYAGEGDDILIPRHVTKLADVHDDLTRVVVYQTHTDPSDSELGFEDSVEGFIVHGNTVARLTVSTRLDEKQAKTLAAELQKNAADAYAKLNKQVR